MCCQGISSLIERLFIPLVLFRAILYVVDVSTDLALVYVYHKQGETQERNWTIIFVALPWTIFLLLVIGAAANQRLRKTSLETGRWKSIVTIVAAFAGLFPVAYFGFAVHEKIEDNKRDRNRGNYASSSQRKASMDTDAIIRPNWRFYYSTAMAFLLFEVVLESLPQFCLQLSIIGKTNRIDVIQFVSILSSLWSIVFGLLMGSQAIFHFMDPNRRSPYDRREFLFKLIFFPWLSMHFVCYVVPVALSAGMKHGKQMSFQLIYFLLHLYFSGVTTFLHAWPFPSSAVAAESRNPRCWPISVLLQIFFTFVSLWTSSSWFVAMTPFVNTTALEDAVLPDFIWPNTSSALHQWTGGVQSNDSFLLCGKGDEKNTVSAIVKTTSLLTSVITTNRTDFSHTARSTSTRLFDAWSLTSDTCLTSVALPLFYTFAIMSFTVLAYHLILLVGWPLIFNRCFSSEAMLALIEKDRIRIEKDYRDQASGSVKRKTDQRLRQAKRESNVERRKTVNVSPTATLDLRTIWDP